MNARLREFELDSNSNAMARASGSLPAPVPVPRRHLHTLLLGAFVLPSNLLDYCWWGHWGHHAHTLQLFCRGHSQEACYTLVTVGFICAQQRRNRLSNCALDDLNIRLDA